MTTFYAKPELGSPFVSFQAVGATDGTFLTLTSVPYTTIDANEESILWESHDFQDTLPGFSLIEGLVF